MSERPLPIVGIAAYYFIFGILAVLGGLVNSVVGALAFCFAPWMIPMGIWGLITGGLNLLLGASIWSGRRTGQGIATFLAVIGIIVALGSALTGNGLPLLSLLVNGFVLFYLQGDEARQFFTR